jgi:hypothetical protein
MSEKKPNVADNELNKMKGQLDAYEDNVKSLTVDRMNQAPQMEVEPQTKLSSREIAKKPEIYLKPKRTIGSKEKFNEQFRDQYNYAKEYVQFIAENYEIIGETMEFWTKPFAGMPAEEWAVPANKPVWAPRYVAEQISRCKYHRLKTVDAPVSTDGGVTHYGTMVADSVINRLDAKPVRTAVPVFMGASAF